MIAVYFPEPSWLFSAPETGVEAKAISAVGEGEGALGEVDSLSWELPALAPVEWPPSSMRFLRALQRTYVQRRPRGVTVEQVKVLLGTLSMPPHFLIPPCAAKTEMLIHIQAGTRVFGEALPSLGSVPLIWVWPEAELSSDEVRAFCRLLEGLGHFRSAAFGGEARLLASSDLEDALPELARLKLSQVGEQPVRVLIPTELEVGEGLARVCWTAAPRLKGRQVSVVQYRLSGQELPSVGLALPLGERVRRAVLCLRGLESGRRERDNRSVDNQSVLMDAREHSAQLTGKDETGAALEGNGHAHYLATDEDGDGLLETVTVWAPQGFSPADVEALLRLRVLTGKRGEELEVRVVSVGDVASSEGSLFGTSRRWVSVTPYSLPRYASRGQGQKARPRDLPEGQVRRELRVRGLPEPVRVETVLGSFVKGEWHPWEGFEQRRLKGSGGYGLAGFELTFAESVSGPLTLGFASHFGLGMFRPVREQE